jgi:hypothetical protein
MKLSVESDICKCNYEDFVTEFIEKLEILKEGQFMKLTLVQLREKLVGNLEEVLKEFNLESYLEQYKNDCSVSPNSSFLLSTDKLIPTNTPLAIFIAQKLLDELEESEDKEEK